MANARWSGPANVALGRRSLASRSIHWGTGDAYFHIAAKDWMLSLYVCGASMSNRSNPLADALGRIFELPADLASTWQQIATVVVVELLVAFSLIAFELLGPVHRQIADSPKPEISNTSSLTDIPKLQIADNRVPVDLREFMLACLPRAKGRRVSWGEVYKRYRDWCLDQSPQMSPVELPLFAEEFGAVCKRVGIKTEVGERMYARNVRLA